MSTLIRRTLNSSESLQTRFYFINRAHSITRAAERGILQKCNVQVIGVLGWEAAGPGTRRSITAMHRYFGFPHADTRVCVLSDEAPPEVDAPEARLVAIAISLLLRPHAGVARTRSVSFDVAPKLLKLPEARRVEEAMRRYFGFRRAWPAHVVCFFAVAPWLPKPPEARRVEEAMRRYFDFQRTWCAGRSPW